jgi:uncharacterized protein YndB with AHSA1/START domain
MMTSLPHVLERSILICAQRATVFRYFTDSARFADWWGQGSVIDGRKGGAFVIRYPNGVTASGEVVDLVPDERVVMSYGYDDPGKPIPPGGSLVTITLHERPGGTLLHLRHEVAEAKVRDEHVQGWRYQLAVFANVAARDQHRGFPELVDRYFAVWGEPEAGRRRQELDTIATDDVSFKDAFSCTSGRDDLVAHLAATQMHMPGLRLRREGDARLCQGTVVADWIAEGPDGKARGRGTNVFELRPDGRIARVVGLWKS